MRSFLHHFMFAVTGLLCILTTANASAMYDPGTGRFMQRDSSGYPDGMNAYAAYHAMRGGLDPSGLEAVVTDVEISGLTARRGTEAITFIEEGLIHYSIALDLDNKPGDSNCCIARLVEDHLSIITSVDSVNGLLQHRGINPATATQAQKDQADNDINVAWNFERVYWQTGFKTSWNFEVLFIKTGLEAIPAGDCIKVAEKAREVVDTSVKNIKTSWQNLYDNDRQRRIKAQGPNDPNPLPENKNWGSDIFDNKVEVRETNEYG